jgi:anti-sigma B factor antagonist
VTGEGEVSVPGEPPPFAVAVVADGARTLLRLQGELDAYTSPRLAAVVERLGDVGGRHVVLDLGDVGFVDSAGLSALVSVLTTVRQGGGAVSLRAVGPQLRKLFEITGLTRLAAVE